MSIQVIKRKSIRLELDRSLSSLQEYSIPLLSRKTHFLLSTEKLNLILNYQTLIDGMIS